MEANTRGGICSFLNDCLCGLMLVCCACDGDWYAVDVGCVGARFLGRLGILWCQVGYWFVCCFGRHLDRRCGVYSLFRSCCFNVGVMA